jgi:hypothetical protein
VSKLQKQQLDEWFESEVTRHLLGLLHKRLDDTFMMRAETFFPGEAHKTQEQKAMLIGEESAWKDIIEALEEQDLSQIHEEEIESESVGHSSERRSDLN